MSRIAASVTSNLAAAARISAFYTLLDCLGTVLSPLVLEIMPVPIVKYSSTATHCLAYLSHMGQRVEKKPLYLTYSTRQ